MRDVIDPEIGINVVDLGLVYAVVIVGHRVAVSMTMTTPSCPMSDMLKGNVCTALREFLGDAWQVETNLVWEPPWSPEMMSDNARDHFGWERRA